MTKQLTENLLMMNFKIIDWFHSIPLQFDQKI